MIVLLVFAFISGFITIFAPCIWPLLPIILSSTTTGGSKKPLGITLGIITSFAVITLSISYIVSIIPFDPNVLRYLAVVVIGFLGITLLIPPLSHILEGYASRLSGKFSVTGKGDGFSSGLITGLSLGIVWTPCAGPILATIATLAATQAVNFQIVLVTIAYVIGVGIPLFVFARVGQRLLTANRFVSKYTGVIQQVFGVIMILTAISIATNYDKRLQVKLLDIFPAYSMFLNQFEGNDIVEHELNTLRGNTDGIQIDMRFPVSKDMLPVLAKAPEFTGITNWINSEELTMEELKGKVVLIDFWTYTCINCIRTLPYVTSWYDKYKDDGFVIVGVHTPEFEFEKTTSNVETAVVQYGLTYPVAQDNDFATWNAYNNNYWPAHYLIDAKGDIRYVHFGEGNYDKTEEAIKILLKEAGHDVSGEELTIMDEEPSLFSRTPETYLGSRRVDRFTSAEPFESGTHEFTFPKSIQTHAFAYSGTWHISDQYSQSGTNAKLLLRYEGNKVFLVMHPTTGNEQVKVFLDNELISHNMSGEDVINGIITLDEPRLYEIVDTKGKDGTHLLRLEFDSGIQIFAFTFG